MSSFTLLRSFSTETQHSQQPHSKQRAKLNKGFSFHQKQLLDSSAVMAPVTQDKKKKALTRRWSSLKQYQTTTLSQQSLATGSSAVSSANPSPQNTASVDSYQRNVTGSGSDVKKKWEVIEHYKGAVNGRETISSSLLAASINFFYKSVVIISNILRFHMSCFTIQKPELNTFDLKFYFHLIINIKFILFCYCYFALIPL